MADTAQETAGTGEGKEEGEEINYPDDYINKVICGDCLEVMKGIPDNSVDLVLTDPPYGISKKRKGEMFITGDTINLLPIVLPLLSRKLKDDGGIFIFVATKFLHETLWQFQTYFKLHNLIIWDKINARYPYQKSNFWRQYEPILYGSKGLFELVDGKHPDIIKCKIDNPMAKNRYMTVQKPINLMIDILKTTKKQKQLVLDPFLGSGTTAVACKQLNRKYIGIEINPDYCRIARERLMGIPDSLFKYH